MIDTVKLTLSKGMYMLKDKNPFQRDKTNVGRGYFTLVQNPTKSELNRGIYKPRLTLTNRFNTTGRSEETLGIELSLPKLIYGNNFDELQDTDFERVVFSLQRVLKTMGVFVFKELLINAPVSTVHYSKNITLTDGTTPHYLISKIKEANINLALGIDQTSYRDGGYSYKWHTNSYEVAFYDKLKDLAQAKISEKRAIETDNSIQLGLYEGMDKRKPFEVLRIEVRLNNRRMMGKLFSSLGISTDLTFEQLYSRETSRKVLQHYLLEIKAKRPKILDYRTKDYKTLLTDIVMANPRLTFAKVLQTFGTKIALDSMPNREFRALFGKKNKHNWYRLNSEIKKVNLPTKLDALDVLDAALCKFETVKAIDFQGVLLNNDKYK